MKTTVNYTLDRGFDYATGTGETQTAQFITINEPTASNVGEMALLRQSLIQAIREQQLESDDATQAEAAAKAEDDEPVAPLEVINMMASTSIDLAAMFAAAQVLLLSRGVCLVDGETKLTSTLWQKMAARDVEKLVGTCIATFILPS